MLCIYLSMLKNIKIEIHVVNKIHLDDVLKVLLVFGLEYSPVTLEDK